MSYYARRVDRSTVCTVCHTSITTQRPLTVRQRGIFDYIAAYVAGNGYAPSFQEIAERFGYTSLATVHEHLRSLEDKGWIRRSYNESRAIELLVHQPPEIAARLATMRAIAADADKADCMAADFDEKWEAFMRTFGESKDILWLIGLAERAA